MNALNPINTHGEWDFSKYRAGDVVRIRASEVRHRGNSQALNIFFAEVAARAGKQCRVELDRFAGEYRIAFEEIETPRYCCDEDAL